MNVPKKINKTFLKRIFKNAFGFCMKLVFIFPFCVLLLMLLRLMIMANIYPCVSDMHYQMR